MKAKDLTLDQWQSHLDEFYRENVGTPQDAAFRIDGTQFSTAKFFGGFTYNGRQYTVFYFTDAMIGVREDFLRWVTKKLKEISVGEESAQADLFKGGAK